MHLNYEYFWRIYELNEYLAKICMHLLLRPLLDSGIPMLDWLCCTKYLDARAEVLSFLSLLLALTALWPYSTTLDYCILTPGWLYCSV